jgi:hypothetical protein
LISEKNDFKHGISHKAQNIGYMIFSMHFTQKGKNSGAIAIQGGGRWVKEEGKGREGGRRKKREGGPRYLATATEQAGVNEVEAVRAAAAARHCRAEEGER